MMLSYFSRRPIVLSSRERGTEICCYIFISVFHVKQRRNRTSHNLQWMRRLICFSTQMNIREAMFGCHFVYLGLCVQFVSLSVFVCVWECTVIVVCVSTFAWVTEASGISTLQSYHPTLSHVIISLLHFL